MNKIFVDGWQGTTGLKIVERLERRKDVTLIKLEGDERKAGLNPAGRTECPNWV